MKKLEDMAWMIDAACKTLDTDLFFKPATMSAAITICNGCSVKDKCLEWRLDTIDPWDADYGIWGGTRPSERSRIRNKRRKP